MRYTWSGCYYAVFLESVFIWDVFERGYFGEWVGGVDLGACAKQSVLKRKT